MSRRDITDAERRWLGAHDYELHDAKTGHWTCPVDLSKMESPRFTDLYLCADGQWMPVVLDANGALRWQGYKMATPRMAWVLGQASEWGKNMPKELVTWNGEEHDELIGPLDVAQRLHDMGFKYAGEGDWLAQDAKGTAYIWYSGPDAPPHNRTDLPGWQPQFCDDRGCVDMPAFADVVAAAVWLKIQAGAP